MPSLRSTAFFSLLALVSGQQAGTLTTETHPALKLSTCTASGTCTAQNTKIVLDANWRWLHSTSDSTNCYTGNEWDDTLCPDPTTCAKNCALDGADYTGTYGINADGNSLKLTLVTDGPYSTNVGSRVYLMSSDTQYYMFKPKNQEFTFDVDVSNLPCGLNGALYLSEMDADGGMAKNPGNKAGAKYGTGYCDAQCPKDMKFINGEANLLDWEASDSDPNAGTGRYGTCCSEFDIWEANSMGEAFTPHVCKTNGLLRCSGADCGTGDDRYNGVCDMDGCDFSAYRTGAKNYYGMGKTVDTTKKMTVVTQFHTANNETSGELSEIRRIYIQNGKEIANSKTSIPNTPVYDSITDEFCADQKEAFGDTNKFASNGGLAAMGDAMDAGMVLSLSIWDDHAANMLWLDSNYPTDGDVSKPGVARGTCATSSGVPADVEKNTPGASVTFSNLKLGPIGSTY